MSTVTSIETQKQKDPKRVEAGKIFAEMNRVRRKNINKSTKDGWGKSKVVPTFIGVAVAGYTLYITMQQQSPPQQQPSPPIVKIAEVTPFDSLE
jgi:hypothetical protein